MKNENGTVISLKGCAASSVIKQCLTCHFDVLQMGQLSNEERNLLSVAYKNSVGSRRAAWRTVSAIQNREAYKGSRHLELINQYRKMIEEELHRICQDVLDLLRDVLIPNSEVAEAKVFYMKMRGDYYRYLCEFTSGET